MRFMSIFEIALNWIVRALEDKVIYAAIVLLFAIGIIFCIGPVALNGNSLRIASKKIKKQQRAVLQSNLFRNKWLRNLWASYQTNLFHLSNHQAIEQETPNCDVEDYFNITNIITLPEKSQFSDILPGIFTSLGILGTFIGLTRGIKGIDMTTAESMSYSIEILLRGMDVAFRTSIAGVVAAIIYNLVRRFVNSLTAKAIRTFVHQCQDVLYQPISADTAMLSLMSNMVDAEKQTAETIKNELVEAFRMELTPALSEVKTAFVEYAVNAENHQLETFSNLVNHFSEKMSFMMHDQIDSLSKAILNTCEMQQRQSDLLEKQNNALNEAVDSLRIHSAGITQIETSCRNMLDQYQSYISKAGEIQLVLTTAAEQFDSHAQLLTASFEKQTQSVQTNFEVLETKLSQFGTGLDVLSERIQNATTSNQEMVSSTLDAMNDHSQKVAASMAQYTEDTHALLQESAQHMSDHSKELQNQISEQFAILTAQTTDQLNKMTAELSGTMDVFHQAMEAMKASYADTSKLFSDNNDEMLKRLDLALTETFKKTQDLQSQINEQYTNMVEAFDEQLTKLTTELHDATAIFNQSANFMKGSYDDFTNNIATGLGQSFTAFDTAMSDAVGHLKQVMDGMQEAIDDIPTKLKAEVDHLKSSVESINALVANVPAALSKETERLVQNLRSIADDVNQKK